MPRQRMDEKANTKKFEFARMLRKSATEQEGAKALVVY